MNHFTFGFSPFTFCFCLVPWQKGKEEFKYFPFAQKWWPFPHSQCFFLQIRIHPLPNPVLGDAKSPLLPASRRGSAAYPPTSLLSPMMAWSRAVSIWLLKTTFLKKEKKNNFSPNIAEASGWKKTVTQVCPRDQKWFILSTESLHISTVFFLSVMRNRFGQQVTFAKTK